MSDLIEWVTTEEATKFLEVAVRNWGKVAFDNDGLEDVRVQLERFAKKKVEAQQAEIARLREALQNTVSDAGTAHRMGNSERSGYSIIRDRARAALEQKP